MRVVACAALAACVAVEPEPRVVSVTPAVVVEGVPTAIDVRVAELPPVPTFDIDRGRGAEETVTVRLEPGALALPSTRIAADLLTAMVPATAAPGRYDVVVQTSGGRGARLRDGLRVAGGSLAIERVWSDRETVTSGRGEVPLFVAVRNRGTCALEGVTVMPRFERDRVDRTGTEYAVRPANAEPQVLAPEAGATLEFRVELLPALQDGEVRLDAFGTARRVSADGCVGTVSAPFADAPGRWLVAAHPRILLEVAELRVNPPEVRQSNGRVNVLARVINQAPVPVHLDLVRLDAEPREVEASVVLGDLPLAPGDTQQLQFDVTLPALSPGTRVTFMVVVTGHDEAGEGYASQQSAPAAMVVVRGG